MKKLQEIDYINNTYGKLTILSLFIKDKKSYCTASCECGQIKEYVFASLKRGLTKSCGCIVQQRPNGCKYTYNIDFFDFSQNSLYVIGLIYTDGSLDQNRPCFQIGLKKEDSNVLKKISLLMRGTESLIISKPRKSPSSDNYTQPFYVLKCTNKILYEKLTLFGLYPSKTNSIKPLDILLNNKDFWRGCIDGDGWVTYAKTKYLRIGFCGTREMCQGFVHFCNQYISWNPSFTEKTNNNYCEITLCGKNAKLIHKILYDNSELYIHRKRFPDKFDTEKALNRNLESERLELEK